MKTKTMTYNELYFALSLVGAALSLKLKPKALAESLIMRSAYLPGIQAFEEIRNQLTEAAEESDKSEESEPSEESATPAEDKTAALAEAADGDSGIARRLYSPEAFEQICEAAIAAETVEINGIAAPAAQLLDFLSNGYVKI